MDDLDGDRLTDPVDIGSYNEEVYRQNAIAAQLARGTPKQIRNEDGTWPRTECECGEQIGEIRLSHGFITCIDCARIVRPQASTYAR